MTKSDAGVQKHEVETWAILRVAERMVFQSHRPTGPSDFDRAGSYIKMTSGSSSRPDQAPRLC